MALDLDEMYKDANPYFTNWFYLNNMTSLQLKALEEMNWYEYSKYIHSDLLDIPLIWRDKSKVRFIVSLNSVITEL
jgi:hypothetical protein